MFKKIGNRPRILTTVIFIAILVLSFLLLIFFIKTASRTEANNALSAQHRLYLDWIKSKGPSQAYSDFKKNFYQANPQAQHHAAHIFGEALYFSEGLSGITTCDKEFNFGCFHSLIGSALAKEGIGKVEEVNDHCSSLAARSDYLICQHGIGHGIAAHLGYGLSNLNQALGICNNLKDIDPIGGCFTGVFMEFNFQTMLAQDAKTRPLTNSSPLYPCDILNEAFRQPCYYVQVDWWMHVLNEENGQKALQIATLCSSLPQKEQYSCSLGMGSYNPDWTKWNIESSQKNCKLLTNRESQLTCLSATAASFYQDPRYQKQAEAICNSFDLENKIHCRSRAGIPI